MHNSALTDTYPAVPNTFPSRPRNPVYAPAFNAADLDGLTPEDILSRLSQPSPIDAYWPQPFAFPKRNIDIHISETTDVFPDHVYPIYQYPNVAERATWTAQNQKLDELHSLESVLDNLVQPHANDKTAEMSRNALEIAESIDTLMKALLIQPTESEAVFATEDSQPVDETTENPAEETDWKKLFDEYITQYALYVQKEKEIAENDVSRQASEEEARTTNPVTEPKAEEISTDTAVLVGSHETEEESSSEMVTAVTETAAKKENYLYRFGNGGLKVIDLIDKESDPTKLDEKPETYVVVEASETPISEDLSEDELASTPKLAEVVELETIESSELIQTEKLDETFSTAKLELPEDSNMTNNIETNEILNIQ